MKFAISVLCVVFFLLQHGNIYAQEEMSSSSAVPTAVPTPVVYQLPYPGLLPDNPLYFLKVLRDRAVNFLISDNLKKTEFLLLQADKRISAGEYLARQRKLDLAESTIAKGENYFEEAVEKLSEAKKQGIDVRILSDRMYYAAKKHRLVIEGLEKNTTGNLQRKFARLRERVEKFKKDVDALRPKEK